MEREKEVYKVTLLGSLINLALMVFKFLAGIFGHSAAMIADAIHSVSDFVTDIVVLAFVRVSHRPKDKSHDYGHGKFETLATTLIGVALFAVAVGIFVDGAKKIVFWANGGTLTQPGILALVAALVSIILKEAIFQYTKRKADELDSQAMRANAWHHRSDALSSIGTAIGIGGAILLGERWAVLDPIASIAVGALIVKVALDLLKNGMGELMEQSLPEEVENEILTIVKNVPGVFEPHDLCTRRIGNHYAIEMHILMDKDIALKEAHDRASEMERLLKERYGEETHISIHVEPREAMAVKNKVRITAIRRTDYPDLMKKYENPIEHACTVVEGQQWISVDGQCPEGFCPSAWDVLRPFVESLACGEGDFFQGWMQDPMSAMLSCNDGFRPVSFYIEVVKE
jgi:uncharacterized repeat protein (TIGR04076 family)